MQKKVIAKKGAISKIICFHSKTVLLVLFLRLLGSGWGLGGKIRTQELCFHSKTVLLVFTQTHLEKLS